MGDVAVTGLVCCPLCNMAIRLEFCSEPQGELSAPVYTNDDFSSVPDGIPAVFYAHLNKADLAEHVECFGYGARMN